MPKPDTAKLIYNSKSNTIHQITTPVSVFQENLQTNKVRLIRQSRKLNDDNDVNQFLLPCYLKTTKLETELLGYRILIHQQYKEKYLLYNGRTEIGRPNKSNS